MTPPTTGLPGAELSAYRERGYVGPFDLVPREHALEIGQSVLSRGRWVKDWFRRGDPRDDRHVDLPALRALSVRRDLLDRVERLLGPDIVLWRSRLFVKGPGAGGVPFHQDDAYYRLRATHDALDRGDRHLGLSAWIALTDTDLANGCVEVIPGSQTETWSHVPVPWAFGIAADQREAARRDRVPLIMKAGQFFLFDNHVVHGSGRNTTEHPRIGFAARYTMPHVSIGDSGVPWPRRSTAALVRGDDSARRTQNADPRGIARRPALAFVTPKLRCTASDR